MAESAVTPLKKSDILVFEWGDGKYAEKWVPAVQADNSGVTGHVQTHILFKDLRNVLYQTQWLFGQLLSTDGSVH